MRTEKEAVEMHHFIQLIHQLLKPILPMTWYRNSQPMLSYGFSISSLQTNPHFFLLRVESTISLAINIASKIYLPSMKAFQDLDITLSMTLLILLANTFVKILYKPLTRLIGLKSLKSSTICFLGIKTKKVAFKLLTNLLC